MEKYFKYLSWKTVIWAMALGLLAFSFLAVKKYVWALTYVTKELDHQVWIYMYKHLVFAIFAFAILLWFHKKDRAGLSKQMKIAIYGFIALLIASLIYTQTSDAAKNIYIAAFGEKFLATVIIFGIASVIVFSGKIIFSKFAKLIGTGILLFTSVIVMQKVFPSINLIPHENRMDFTRFERLKIPISMYGRGINPSSEKIIYLPENYADFSYSIFDEEYGYRKGLLLLNSLTFIAFSVFAAVVWIARLRKRKMIHEF